MILGHAERFVDFLTWHPTRHDGTTRTFGRTKFSTHLLTLYIMASTVSKTAWICVCHTIVNWNGTDHSFIKHRVKAFRSFIKKYTWSKMYRFYKFQKKKGKELKQKVLQIARTGIIWSCTSSIRSILRIGISWFRCFSWFHLLQIHHNSTQLRKRRVENRLGRRGRNGTRKG